MIVHVVVGSTGGGCPLFLLVPRMRLAVLAVVVLLPAASAGGDGTWV
jgi:hypothetical protein